MKNYEKAYLFWKNNTKNRLSKDHTRNLVGVLVNNKISEEELIDFGKKFKIETKQAIEKAGKNKSVVEREMWFQSLEDAFDCAHIEYFPGELTLEAAEVYVSPGDLNARRAGFQNKKQMDDYLDQIPTLDTSKIERVVMSDEQMKEFEDMIKNIGLEDG